MASTSRSTAPRRASCPERPVGDVFLEQLYTFGDLRRDPRGRVITRGLLRPRRSRPLARGERRRRRAGLGARLGALGGRDRRAGRGRGPTGTPLPLAFDHADILGLAVKRLRGKLDYTPIGFQLLPAEFTLRELQRVHEAVRGEPVNKDSFRRRMLASGLLEATGAHERDVDAPPRRALSVHAPVRDLNVSKERR